MLHNHAFVRSQPVFQLCAFALPSCPSFSFSLDRNAVCRSQSCLCCHEFVHASGSGNHFLRANMLPTHKHSHSVTNRKTGSKASISALCFVCSDRSLISKHDFTMWAFIRPCRYHGRRGTPRPFFHEVFVPHFAGSRRAVVSVHGERENFVAVRARLLARPIRR